MNIATLFRWGLPTVALCLFAGGCASASGPVNTGWEQRGADGLYYHKGTDRLYDGTFQLTGEGEQFRGQVVGGRREGAFVATSVGGLKKSELHYRNNVLNGAAQSWYENRKLRTDLEFANGKFVRGVTYKPDGQEATRADKGTGQLTAYFDNGKINWEKTWESGVQVRDVVYNPDGSVKTDRWGEKPKPPAPAP